MSPMEAIVNPPFRGSLLDADHPQNGVLIPRRFTTYQQYVTELTYLLFLKMMSEQKREQGRIPKGMRWQDLVSAEGVPQLSLYRRFDDVG